MIQADSQLSYNPIYSNSQTKRPLPASFQPGPYDVICARGKLAHSHEGNKRFRDLVKLHKDTYAKAETKYQKSQVVSHIVNLVRESTEGGMSGFVKSYSGKWFEVGDRAAKEKIGQTMRDLLHTKYTSSTKAKARVRVQKRIEEYKQEEEEMMAQNAPSRRTMVQDDSEDKSFVSVVSNDSGEDMPPLVPSSIQVPAKTTSTPQLGMFIPTETTSSGEALLDALFEGESTLDPFPVAPVSMDLSAVPIEFHDSDLEQSVDQLEGDLLEFCNVMGIAFTC